MEGHRCAACSPIVYYAEELSMPRSVRTDLLLSLVLLGLNLAALLKHALHVLNRL